MMDLSTLLGERSPRRFKTQMAIADAMSGCAAANSMKLHEVIDGVICSLVSIVQARAPAAEWGTVGESLCEELRRRLTVTGDTGAEHHARRMV